VTPGRLDEALVARLEKLIASQDKAIAAIKFDGQRVWVEYDGLLEMREVLADALARLRAQPEEAQEYRRQAFSEAVDVVERALECDCPDARHCLCVSIIHGQLLAARLRAAVPEPQEETYESNRSDVEGMAAGNRARRAGDDSRVVAVVPPAVPEGPRRRTSASREAERD
jgi:hypothetical protein